MPWYVRVLTFLPYFIVVAFLVVMTMKLGWGLAIWLAVSLLFAGLVAAWLRRHYRTRA